MKHLYDAIFMRKSVRKYDPNPLPSMILDRIKEHIEQVEPLDENIRYKIVIKNADEIKTSLKAAHYLCFYSEETDRCLMNAGYIMQQIDLHLSLMGIGACWLGMAKPKINESVDGLPFVILIAFGSADETVHRRSVEEFKRKSIAEFSTIPDHAELLGPVRLAPSAVNSQSWVFSCHDDKFVIARKKPSLISSLFMHRFNQIDIGIAMCYFQISALQQGKRAIFEYEACPVDKGTIFMASANLEEVALYG